MSKKYYIYILEVKNGNYYTGYTTDIARRYAEHQRGTKASKYTRSFGPVKLKQCWKLTGEVGIALKIEYLIKRQNRRTKEQLVETPQLLKKIMAKGLGLNTKVTACSVKKFRN